MGSFHPKGCSVVSISKMSAYLRVVVLCLLISFTFSEEEYEEEPEFEISATSEYNELIGTFDDDLRNDLGNLAIGTKSFQVRN